MSNIYEDNQQIPTGSHGRTDYVFASGAPVPNSGGSRVVYESGYGVGGGNLTVRVYDANDNLIASAENIEDREYRDGGIGFKVNNGGGTDTFYFDNAVLQDGTVIDNFESTDLSNYTGATGQYSLTTSPTYEGNKSLAGVAGGSPGQPRIFSMSGLNTYPQPGDTWSVRMYYSSNMSSMDMLFGVQSTTDGSSTPACYSAELTGSVGIVQDALSVNKHDGNGNTTRLVTVGFDASSYEQEWVKVEIFWS